VILKKQVKNLNKRENGSEILAQYTVPYGLDSLSRYKHIDELLLIDNNIIKATLGPVDLSIIPHNGLSTYTVPNYEENRIDLVATKLYGRASLYWIICYVNNISDPLVLPAGRILFIPDIQSLKRFPNPLA
jgi:hypothetical protein